MELIKAENVVKQQGQLFSLGPVNLELHAGEVLGVTGDPGAGKTTLLKLIWGFLRPDQGMVSVFRQQPHLNQISVRRHVGYLHDSPTFNQGTTVRRHIQFVSHFYEGWNVRTTDLLLEQFGIDPETCVHRLSNGAKTKLALIAATGHNPFLLLLDNPMTGLNSSERREISQFVKSLAKERGVGIVMSSQSANELTHLADSILCLHQGKSLSRRERVARPPAGGRDG